MATRGQLEKLKEATKLGVFTTCDEGNDIEENITVGTGVLSALS